MDLIESKLRSMQRKISPRTARLWVLALVLIIVGVFLGRLVKAALISTTPFVESQLELHVG